MTWFMILMVGFLQSAAPVRVQVGTSVRPETTTVGQHFIATVRIRVPVGTDVRFPGRPDSAAHVDCAGSTARHDSTAGGYTESTMNYVLAAWDTGSQRLGLDSVAVVTRGIERIVALNGLNVYVRSVLPSDTSLRKPKPYRPVVAGRVVNWIPWLIGAAVLALLGIGWYTWRRWRRRAQHELSAWQLAQREFARIDAERLVESGETERYAVDMVRVARTYLATAVPLLARSATTRELISALSTTEFVPRQRLVAILDETDMFKFARERSSVEQAIAIGAEARRIVNETAAALAAAEASPGAGMVQSENADVAKANAA